MTEEESDGEEEQSIWETESDDEVVTQDLSTSFKVRGRDSLSNGAGVLGENTAGSGDAPGVTGLTSSDEGYGLATPDDLFLKGTIDTGRTEFVVEAGTLDDGTARNVIMGHRSNTTDTGVSGATISGGGIFNGDDIVLPNLVTASGGTVGGGAGNKAKGKSATVSGGRQNVASGTRSTIGGGIENEAKKSKSTVSGGGNNTADGLEAAVVGGNTNKALDSRAVVLNGKNNTADGLESTIVGGNNNDTTADLATIVGGSQNDATSGVATIIAGTDCKASGGQSTVIAGISSEATGDNSIAIGPNNVASGDGSVAVGQSADTNGKQGAMVFADSSSTAVQATEADQVVFQAGGDRTSGTAVELYSQSDGSAGVKLDANDGTWQSLSSRASKADIDTVTGPDVLEEVEQLDISTWRYDGQDESIRHMGPMAEDFYDAFELGSDEEHIATLDTAGVALAAVQGLSERLADRDDRIEELESELEDARDAIDERDDRIDELEERLSAIEDQFSADD